MTTVSGACSRRHGTTKVAESGIRTSADIARLTQIGYDAFLVGEHLMSAPDPGTALQQLIQEAGAA